MHDRLDEHITEQSCKSEIQSFLEHGQLVPVLGRRLRGDPDYDVELICGARRLFVARHINVPLLVEVREMSDRDGIVAMDLENRLRKDISPYERGLSYARWLRTAYFASQEDIANALKVSPSQVSRLLKLARLPSIVIDAFGSAVSVCEGWGLQIAEALDDPQRRQRTLHAARTIAATLPRPSPSEVFRQLLAASAPGRKPKRMNHDKVVRGGDGKVLFRIRHQRSTVAILLPVEHIAQKSMLEIEEAIVSILGSRAAPPRREPISAGPLRSSDSRCVVVGMPSRT